MLELLAQTMPTTVPGGLVAPAGEVMRTGWLPLVMPIASAIVATAAAYIAFLQWRTARNTARDKLKLDLYDRRLTICVGYLNRLSAGVSGNMNPLPPHENSAVATYFLFGDEVAQHVAKSDRIMRKWADLWSKAKTATREEGRALIPEMDQAFRDLQMQVLTAKDVFKPYLSFVHLDPPKSPVREPTLDEAKARVEQWERAMEEYRGAVGFPEKR